MEKFPVILLFLVIFLAPPFAAGQDCSVSLKNGTVFGTVLGTFNPSKKMCAYTAIPYAAPPVNALRFQAPQPANAWGILNATSLPNSCPQKDTPPAGVQISEDCLYLNVYQPKQNGASNASLPVMIWFHGGGFTGGSSLHYTPSKLLTRGDVIVVVVQYRLGLLGFLSTGDATIPGNNGLKDQSFSIRWVNENIAAFGGNPNQVTIFGESAGGASVIHQLISPLNKGLIHGVIAQSGTALASWAVDRNPAASAKLMAKRLGCTTVVQWLMVRCLRKVSWQNIVKVQNDFANESYMKFKWAYATVSPVIEPKGVTGAFITEEPATIMESGEIPDIPVMIGATKHDGSFVLATMYYAKIGPQKLDKNADYMRKQIVPDILSFFEVPDSDPGNRAVASSVELAYLSGVNRSSWSESMPGLVDIMSVFAFKSSAQNTAEILSARSHKVYLYSFDYHSNNSFGSGWSSQIPVSHGVAHADDLIYLFNVPGVFSTQDVTMAEVMLDMWLNFATFGNPTPSPDKRFQTWEPYNNLDEPYMKLNVSPTMQYGYRNSWRPNGFEWN